MWVRVSYNIWGMRKYFPIYEEAVCHIWLCNCSMMNISFYMMMQIWFSFLSVYVLSSELGLSHPFSGQRVCPSPQNQRGGPLACGWGVWGVPIPTTGEKLSTLSTLCSRLRFSVFPHQTTVLTNISVAFSNIHIIQLLFCSVNYIEKVHKLAFT